MSSTDKIKKHLFDMTAEELTESFNQYLKEIEDAYGDIPKDKDCAKCPHSTNGQCSGMVTPCFDICSGDAFGGMCASDSPASPTVKSESREL